MLPRDFNALLFLGTIGWMPTNERLQLRQLNIACGHGLAAVRQGRPEDGLHYYQLAKRHLDSLENGERLAWLLGTSTYQAGIAYLEFRRSWAELARERLDWSMEADLELEEAGLPVMQMHRIQQGHNVVRMDLRLGRREAAIRLAGMLLAYMERQIAHLPIHRKWRPKSLQAVPRTLQKAMIHQVISETASFIVTGEAPAMEWRSLVEASELCREPEAAVFPQVQYALRARYARTRVDPEGYLGNLARFFRFGIRHSPMLWYVVMVDLVDFCRETDTSLSRQVRDLILRDSTKLQNLPAFLRNCLGRPAARLADA